MCGKPVHRVDAGYRDLNNVWVEHRHCYMDYFCDIGFCDARTTDHPNGHVGGECDCPLEEEEDP